ncbi:Afadin and alpha-actinin-binding-domain-containing protein [Xylaria palmicola]|nr:Afadin and alpha-actinin-binding-domain-containing protein [Xylaria palmicola]
MIDPENLRTASLYINNQLLSRGLLRDGQNIDFADPEGSDGGVETAMGRIISVVNDLILRRDRDAEHRESLSSTLRALRADVQRQTTESARQTERLNDTQRRVDSAEATERALRDQLRTAEQGIYKLKEEMAKMKSIVAQTRGACANEVRKRDRQIDSLKKSVAEAARVRGGNKSRDVVTISITGEVDSEGDKGMGMPLGATEAEGYSLRMETNEFLTELAKGLSEENESLLALVQRTVNGLREMSGLDRSTDLGHEQGHNNAREEHVTQLPQKSADELAAELEATINHLRSILTNPSFVPIEEVEVRDQAIGRLRAGMETMEARWKDAVHMIDGWRRRMASSGKSVDMEDLQMGLRLSPVRVRDVEETAHVEPMRLSCVQEEEEEEEEDVGQYDRRPEEEQEPKRLQSRSPVESLRLVPASDYDAADAGDDSESDSSIFQDDLDLDDLDVEEPNVQILQISTADSIDSSPLPEPPQISPLKDSYSSGNRGAVDNPPYRKRPGDFTTIVEENTWELAAAEEKAPATTPQPSSPGRRAKMSSPRADGERLPSYTASYDSPLFGKSGPKPTQAQLNRKLFSKPSVQSPGQNTGASSSRSRGAEGSPPRTRTTRSSARRSAGASSTSSQAARSTAVEPDVPTAAPAAAAAAAPNPPITATKQQRQTAEAAPRDASVNSSSPSSSSSPLDNKSLPHRSPPRPQQPAPSSSSSSSSRLPRPHAQQQQNPLNMATIAAKLAASEREADAARVRAKLKAVRRSRRISGEGVEMPAPGQGPAPQTRSTRSETRDRAQAAPAPAPASASASTSKSGDDERDHQNRQQQQQNQQSHGEEDVDPVKRDRSRSRSRSRSPRKSPLKRGPRRRWSRAVVGLDEVDELSGAERGQESEGDREAEGDGEGVVGLTVTKRRRTKRSSKVASRRRSTLSPWELQGLISGNVGSPAR